MEIKHESSNNFEILFIYRGMRLSSRNTKIYTYIKLINGSQCNFKQKLTTADTIGSIIKTITEDNKIFKKAEFIRKLDKNAEYFSKITKWRIEEESCKIELQHNSSNKQIHSQHIQNKFLDLINAIKYCNKIEKQNIAIKIYKEILN